MAFKLRSQGSSFKMMGASPVKQSKKRGKKIMKKLSRKIPIAKALSYPAFAAIETIYDVKTDKSKASTKEKTIKHAKQNIGEGAISNLDDIRFALPTSFQTILSVAESFTPSKYKDVLGQFSTSQLIPKEYGGDK